MAHFATRPLAALLPNISELGVMTHKYRGCIIVLLINRSVDPNEEQKVLKSGMEQEIPMNT